MTISSPKKPSVILSAWDKTLADNWGLIIEAVNHTFSYFGMPTWSSEEAEEKISLSARELFPTLFFDNTEKALEVFYDFFETNHLEYVKPTVGSQELLDFCFVNNFVMGVVSNKKSNLLKKEITKLGYERYFDVIVGAGDATEDKPSAEPIKLALRKISKRQDITFNCDDILYIGDSKTDQETAKNFGCVCYIVGEDNKEGKALYEETVCFRSLSKIITHMKKNML